MTLRSDFRAGNYSCLRCAAPVADAEEIRRTVHLTRSGEWIGSRGEFVTLRCACGEARRLLWTVQVSDHARAA